MVIIMMSELNLTTYKVHYFFQTYFMENIKQINNKQLLKVYFKKHYMLQLTRHNILNQLFNNNYIILYSKDFKIT